MLEISSVNLRELYQRFFVARGHVRIPSAPLVPKNDASVLFTTAGMHPLVPYLKGQKHPAGTRLTNVQKCLRTTDIETVGDATHATVFEMLGNWSLGDYFKDEAIALSWEFLTGRDWLNIDPAYLAVSVFAGDSAAARDDESARLWQAVGLPNDRIAYLGVEENWWPASGDALGPQGPDTEMFYWTGGTAAPPVFDPTDPRWVEIWNDVFMQYTRDESGELSELRQQNVDTGMGLERVVMVLGGMNSIYDIDTFAPLMRLIDDAVVKPDERQRRILADHIKAFTFVLGDEVPVLPSNTDQGYVARRLIRRAVLAARQLGVTDILGVLQQGSGLITEQYADYYPSLRLRGAAGIDALGQEVEKFDAAMRRGFEEIEKASPATMDGYYLFKISSTYAVPAELIAEYAREHNISLSENLAIELEQARKDHQEKSRTAAAGKFKGGLADHSKESVRYHTATHLLHQALREVLGEHVLQKGSNITPQRLRFDFSHPQKMTPDELEVVEKLVNKKIDDDLLVVRHEMTVAEARQAGALGLFEERYGDRVNVYRIGEWSTEICGGPHVERTGELGQFTITKEESAGSGVRRIKAQLR